MIERTVLKHSQLRLCVTKLQVYAVGLVSQQWRLGCVTSENTRDMYMLCYCNTVGCLHKGHFKILLVIQREVKKQKCTVVDLDHIPLVQKFPFKLIRGVLKERLHCSL